MSIVMFSSKRPIYLQIYEDIKEKIFSNIYQGDDFLPSERELAENYNVERATIRRSLALLVTEGLLTKIPGAGSKVNGITKEEHNSPAKDANNIAFILPGDTVNKITEPFYSSVFYRFEMECKANGYNLFYTNLKGDFTLPDNILSNNVCAIVWVSSIPTQMLNFAKTLSIPSVLISNTSKDFLSILTDNVGGSCQAVEHLLALGHNDIAYINGINTYINAIERLEGYIRTLHHANIPIKNTLIKEGIWTFEGGYNATMELLESKEKFTAVYAANDMMALGVMRALSVAGLSAPLDISVIGFDNIEQCKYSTPTLSTIGIDAKMLAKQIMNSLKQMMIEESPPVKMILPTTLYTRESTGIVKC